MDNCRKENLIMKPFIFLLIFTVFLLSCENNEKSDAAMLSSLLLAGGSQTASEGTPDSCPSASFPAGYYPADTAVYAPAHNSDLIYKNKSLSVNGVCGKGLNSGSVDVFTLDKEGPGSVLILSWAGSHGLVQNIPNKNDFIIFENAFRISGNPDNVFTEPGTAEVLYSGEIINFTEENQDTFAWCGFNPQFTGIPSDAYSSDPDDWLRFTGIQPVIFNQDTFDFSSHSPDVFFADQSLRGGDAFKLEDLTVSGNCTETARSEILNNGFRYLRIRSAYVSGFPVNSVGDGAPDIDGVIAASVITP